ncbi:saccharopine dehydrogenase family protein [Mycobacterium sp. NPDC050041]|uniref:saccharopine dehydrogenase family protein n=1 Tax=Mycobacterium sp. NPDC050041 TaxID=3364293 RepID=UPI003C2C4D72
MGAAQRDLDIVLYGATGFVGKLTARYLARVAPGVRIALAGRSPERLRAVRDGLGERAGHWPLLVAELSDPVALQEMSARTRVVVSTIGPYTRHGLPVVAACAATGTDYADLTGEVPFVRACADRYHQQARDTGARIVHSCGFDSIPSDLTVYGLHRRVTEDAVGELGDTTLVLRAYSGGYASGSISTMLDLMRIATDDPAVQTMLDDPYSLSPDRSAEPELGAQPDLPLCPGAEVAPELAGLWAGGYVMALYNTRCVRRSNALLGWPYGRGFRYRETLTMGSSPASPFIAAMFNMGITGASRFGGHLLRMAPPGLVEKLLPAPGTGHDEGARGYYRVETYTTTTTGRRYVTTMAQQGDPGYSATSVLLGESALALAVDRDRLLDRHGVLTPATAIGDVLLDRLPAAGVTFETTALD